MPPLSTPPVVNDPKRQIDAYLVLAERHLYQVIAVNADGSVQAMNCKTGFVYSMSDTNLKNARLVLPLCDETMAALDAALEATPTLPEAA